MEKNSNPLSNTRVDGTTRPLQAEVFMGIAELIAERSTCPKGARHGAVLVLNRHVVAMGYGSPAAGIPTCQRCWLREKPGKKDWESCPSVHAEANALLMAARFGISVDGADLYVTKAPCGPCLRMLHNAGVVTFYIRDALRSRVKPYAVWEVGTLASPREVI